MNNKALNAIFTSLDSNMFALVTNCVCAKQAWKKLQMHCEGSESVRRTKIRILTTQFENLRMEESETIDEYERRLRKIENEAIDLGDAISNERLEVNESDLGDESIDLLTKQFGNYLKRMRDSKKPRQKSKAPITPVVGRPLRIDGPEQNTTPSKIQFRTQSEGKTLTISKRIDFVKCHECTGFGHYANECPTRLRRGMNASLSNDEVEEGIEQGEEETHNALTVLMQKKSNVVASVATLSHNTHRK
ncbi:uncharacterized protein [Henckelia pumila]|uniref:uncharacterized protein n=1 Tax=Henckelia pumila TaxID=405737 RepID=UPI003C6E0F5E